MAKYGNSGMHRRGIVSRVVGYIMIGFISFVLKRIQHRIIKEQMSRCNHCSRKMDMIKKNEYYCKYCNIMRIYDGDI